MRDCFLFASDRQIFWKDDLQTLSLLLDNNTFIHRKHKALRLVRQIEVYLPCAWQSLLVGAVAASFASRGRPQPLCIFLPFVRLSMKTHTLTLLPPRMRDGDCISIPWHCIPGERSSRDRGQKAFFFSPGCYLLRHLELTAQNLRNSATWLFSLRSRNSQRKKCTLCFNSQTVVLLYFPLGYEKSLKVPYFCGVCVFS